jgi:molybdopterin molybdotransferase
MGCCDTHGLMPFEQALKTLLNRVDVLKDIDTENLDNSLDRILASDIHAPINVPNYDNSAMDGYAIKADDLADKTQLRLVGEALAGRPYTQTLKHGDCVRIMTGAPIPSGADSVVMQEDVAIIENNGERWIQFSDRIPSITGTQDTPITAVRRGNHVRYAGEDIRAGEIILHQGKRLSPADLGLIASLGLAQVDVYRRLKVALLSTGDELKLPGQPLDQGCIYDSNRVVVTAILKRLGVEILDLGIIPDQVQALEQAFAKASRLCDAIISSGGVSVGDADYTKEVLTSMGEIGFWKVAIKPGKPFAFGHLNQAVFFGLPGNPVSAAVTFHQLALPALQKMSGERTETNISLGVATQHSLKKRSGRTDFQRGVLSQNDLGHWQVCDTGSQGSGMLSSMSRSNCYIKLAADSGNIEAGQAVEVIPYDRWVI